VQGTPLSFEPRPRFDHQTAHGLNLDAAVKPMNPQARGEILRQRRRPTVKFRSHFAFWCFVTRAELAITALLLDFCLGATNSPTSLRKGFASRCAAEFNCGIRAKWLG
jgi:hypothetical protein